MPRLSQTPDRYLHSPRLVASADGSATLSAIAWACSGVSTEGAEECVVSWPIAADGTLGAEQAGPGKPFIVSLTRGSEIGENDTVQAELEEQRAGARVWVEHADGIASVKLARQGQAEVLVFRARGSALSPALALAADGTWVAFHHDVREDTGEADVSKWIALRFVDRLGAVHEPASAMIERSRDEAGIEQSFEFPALMLGDDGALSVFGRGSHNFWRQDLSAQGFSARFPLSDGEWGSRGRHVAVVRVRDGIVAARRDRRGIEVDLLPHASGGAPALRQARIDWVAPARVVSEARSEVLLARESARFDPAAARGLRTLFGDIQQHSAHSDGIGSAHEAYLRARYRYGDDFVALTDHESFLGKRTGPGEWEYLQRVAEHHDAPGQFATLYAYEWTGKAYPGPGHKCVYFPTRGFPIVSRDDVPEGKALVERVHALGGFASPHHIGWTGADEAGHDDVGQPLWEICSCHGCYEHVDHPLGQRGALRDHMADEMLRRGHRFGFTASSDSHGLLWHHGEARKRDPYRTGLTAVQASAVTREAITEALLARRCYATSGAKILLDVTADGHAMGSVLDDRDSAELTVRVMGTNALQRIELIGQAGVLARSEPSAVEAQFSARVASPFVYVRITQADGEMAWSSPVFLGPKG